jgi:protoporphyrinogen oxidase
MSDADAVAVALRDLARMNIVDAKPRGFCVLRLPKAYPVYFKGYQAVTQALFGELAKVEGLVLAGRNAMYKWNNMHHSVKTGLLAARIVMGEKHDLTQVKGMVAIGKDSD